MRQLTTECKRCGARVWIAFTARYRRVPLNPNPVQGGEYLVETNGHGDPIVRPATRGLVRIGSTGPRYERHTKTCPRRPA